MGSCKSDAHSSIYGISDQQPVLHTVKNTGMPANFFENTKKYTVGKARRVAFPKVAMSNYEFIARGKCAHPARLN